MTDEEAATILVDSVHIPYRLRKTNEEEERQQVDFAKVTKKKIIDNKNMKNQGEAKGEKKIRKDARKDDKKKRKYIVKDDIRDAKKKRKEQSIQVFSGAEKTDLKKIHSLSECDFVTLVPKKFQKSEKVKISKKVGKSKILERKNKNRGKKQAEKDDSAFDNEIQTTVKYNVIRSRTSPKTLSFAIQSLTKSQRQCVEEMGFGKLLDLKLDGIPSKLGFYVVDRFDEKEMKIRLNNGSITVTKDSVHDMLGVPNGGIQLQSLHGIDTEDSVTGEWKKQYGKSLIRPNDVMRQIVNSKDAGWNFKLNFLILFSNTMAECMKMGICNLNMLLYIRQDTIIKDIDWCGYIWDCLMVSKSGWKRDSPISYYTGPITVLTLLYLDATVCNKVPVIRQRPAIRCWNMELMRQREFAEIGEGGFGLGDLQDPYEPTYVENEDFPAIEEGPGSERPQNKVCGYCNPFSPTDIEGYLLKLDATFSDFESTLTDAMLEFPGMVNIKEWSTKFESLLGRMSNENEKNKGDLLKDTKNEKKGASLEGDNDEELEGRSSSTDSDFATPYPKKPKKDTKCKAIVSGHADETVEDVATPLSMKYNVIRSRTSPKTLYETISSLTKSQMEVVRQMGFGSLLQLKMDGIPWKLGYYIVDNLDTKKMEITMKSRSLKITKDAIHHVLGLPNEGTDLFDLDSHEDNIGEWKNQFGKVRIHLKDVMRDINTSRDAGWRFKMNFITLFSNTMATTFSNGTCNPIVLSHINKDTDFNQIDWCKYIWDSLKTSKVGWNRDNDNIFYTGPITFLTLFYADSTKCNIILNRQMPVLANWTTQQLKQREEAEIRAGGFGNLELQDPVQEVEVQELQAIESAHVVETKGNREEGLCTTSSSNNVEAFLKEINTRITQFLTEKVMIETALQEALLQHPGVVEIEECKIKFHALFQEKFVADATNEMERMDEDRDHRSPSTNAHELVMQDIIAEEAEKEKLHFDEALLSTEKQDLIVDNTIAPEAEKDQTYSNGDDIAHEFGVNEVAQEDITLHTTTE